MKAKYFFRGVGLGLLVGVLLMFYEPGTEEIPFWNRYP